MPICIFDIDGTLTDSVAAHQRCFSAAFRHLGMDRVNENWGQYRHHTDSGIFREAFAQAHGRAAVAEDEQRFVAALVQAWRDDRPQLRAIAGAADFVRQIAASRAVRHAFATGSYRDLALAKLQAVGIACPEPLLVSASEFETREQIVGAAVDAARQSGRAAAAVDDGAIISFGDGLWDWQTARNLQLHFVGIAEGPRAGQLRQAGAQLVVEDFRALSGWPKWLDSAPTLQSLPAELA